MKSKVNPFSFFTFLSSKCYYSMNCLMNSPSFSLAYSSHDLWNFQSGGIWRLTIIPLQGSCQSNWSTSSATSDPQRHILEEPQGQSSSHPAIICWFTRFLYSNMYSVYLIVSYEQDCPLWRWNRMCFSRRCLVTRLSNPWWKTRIISKSQTTSIEFIPIQMQRKYSFISLNSLASFLKLRNHWKSRTCLRIKTLYTVPGYVIKSAKSQSLLSRYNNSNY